MAINKSIIEDFELSTGTQVYLQAGNRGSDIRLSFDGDEASYGLTIKLEEARELMLKLSTVIAEVMENGEDK